MPITIQPYTDEMVPQVHAFNQLLEAGEVAPEFRFPESSVPAWLPPLADRRIYQQYYLAVEGGAVRGGFILKYQDFRFSGQTRRIAYYHLPLSLGIVSKAYASVGVMMLRAALKQEPVLFALGMGGFDRPLPLMLKAMRWKLSAVPFFFRVINPASFLRHISVFRRSRAVRSAARVASRTGAGWLAIHAAQKLRMGRNDPRVRSEQVSEFGAWADDLWRDCSSQYALIGNRDRSTLNVLYPPGKRFVRLKVLRDSQTLGWAVVLNTQMRDHKYFGSLRVGSIVDCLASPESARFVVRSAGHFLAEQGSDLIVANHSHDGWGRAFVHAGFLSGPSNFIFAPSPALAELLGNSQEAQSGTFLMRGDGDGPVNL